MDAAAAAHQELVAKRHALLTQLEEDRENLRRIEEEHRLNKRRRKYHRHQYYFARDSDSSMSSVALIIRYVQSGLFLCVLTHFLFYFSVQFVFIGFFVMFPDLSNYFKGLSFGEASFLISFVIGSVFASQMQSLDQSFKDQPRSVQSIFHRLSLLSDDLASFVAIEMIPHEARTALVASVACLLNLSTLVLRSYYAAEGRNRSMGEDVVANVRAQFSLFRQNYRSAIGHCCKAGMPTLLPEVVSQTVSDIRTSWVDNTLFRINFRGHDIAMWHVNFFVGIYLYGVLPAQMYGALNYFALVLYPLVMTIFAVQGIVYTFLGNPFDSMNQTKLQPDDFIKLERSHRMHIAEKLIEAIDHHLQHPILLASPPPVDVSTSRPPDDDDDEPGDTQGLHEE